MNDDLETRIRERAHQIWLDDGCPTGRADQHWELAKMAVALEDARPEMLKPVDAPVPTSEPLDAWVNQAEFPTLTDQGEQHAPGELADPDR
jgi:hypothetical protein